MDIRIYGYINIRIYGYTHIWIYGYMHICAKENLQKPYCINVFEGL